MVTVSIVIPAHNEAENIGPLIREIEELKIGYPYEIIIVDDASTDETYPEVAGLKSEVPGLKILRHERSYGQSAAIATGIRHAGGDVIVTMDGDGQNNPADIPRLIYALLTGNNPYLRMIAGYRKQRHDSRWRVVSSRIANAVRGFLLHDRTPDTGCGLKVFYRSAFLNLPFFDHMHRFLPALVRMQGGDVVSMEVSHRPRMHGRSKYGTLNRLWVGIVDICGVFWLRLRAKEVRLRRCAP